jgi:hypothetical protein
VVTEEIAKIIAWDGSGVPPPPPGPPNTWSATGLDFFGIVQRRCDKLNEAAQKQYEEDRVAYDIIFRSKRRQSEALTIERDSHADTRRSMEEIYVIPLLGWARRHPELDLSGGDGIGIDHRAAMTRLIEIAESKNDKS